MVTCCSDAAMALLASAKAEVRIESFILDDRSKIAGLEEEGRAA